MINTVRHELSLLFFFFFFFFFCFFCFFFVFSKQGMGSIKHKIMNVWLCVKSSQIPFVTYMSVLVKVFFIESFRVSLHCRDSFVDD